MILHFSKFELLLRTFVTRHLLEGRRFFGLRLHSLTNCLRNCMLVALIYKRQAQPGILESLHIQYQEYGVGFRFGCLKETLN